MLELGQEFTSPFAPEFVLLITNMELNESGLVSTIAVVALPKDLKTLSIDSAKFRRLKQYVDQFIRKQLGYSPPDIAVVLVNADYINEDEPLIEFGDFDAFEEVITTIYNQCSIKR